MTEFPFFKQADTMDCGPACLQMIAKYYGKDIALSAISKITALTRTGTSLLSLSEAALQIGFNTRSVKITLDEMREKELFPCIAHLHKRHFVVIYEIAAHKISIADPATGLQEYSEKDFIEGWAIPDDELDRGIVLLLEPK